VLTGYAPPGWLLKAHPNPRPNLDLKLNPNRISDPDPDPDPNPDQVCFLEVGPARAPLARYLPILMPFYLRCVRHLPNTFLSGYLLTGAFDYCGSHCVWHLAVVAAVVIMDQACQQLTLTLTPTLTLTRTRTLTLTSSTRRASRSLADRGTVATVRCLVDVGSYI
jgi:hypothetical protein